MTDPEGVLHKVGVPSEGQEDRSVIHLPGAQLVRVGKSEEPAASMPEIVCKICFEPTRSYSALACGHAFCNVCYSTYVGHKIADEGHQCTFATCPEEKCKLTITRELVLSLCVPRTELSPQALRPPASAPAPGRAFRSISVGADALCSLMEVELSVEVDSEVERSVERAIGAVDSLLCLSGGGAARRPLPEEKLTQFHNANRIERSYVDDNANMRWCSATDCTYAVHAPKGQLGVTCKCGNRFCFSCGQADHRPCSCDNLAKWTVKCASAPSSLAPPSSRTALGVAQCAV